MLCNILEAELPSSSLAISAFRDLAVMLEVVQEDRRFVQMRQPGRPRIGIAEEQLCFFVKSNSIRRVEVVLRSLTYSR